MDVDDPTKEPKDRTMWYKPGPFPPIESSMTKKNHYMHDLIVE